MPHYLYCKHCAATTKDCVHRKVKVLAANGNRLDAVKLLRESDAALSLRDAVRLSYEIAPVKEKY